MGGASSAVFPPLLIAHHLPPAAALQLLPLGSCVFVPENLVTALHTFCVELLISLMKS